MTAFPSTITGQDEGPDRDYALVTTNNVSEKPDIQSPMKTTISTGDMFFVEEFQQLPDNPYDLPDEELKKLYNRYTWGWKEFAAIEYAKKPGIILNDLYNSRRKTYWEVYRRICGNK